MSPLGNDDKIGTVMVATKGMLRPDVMGHQVFDIDGATEYFFGQTGGLSRACPDLKDPAALFDRTPYSTWWAFYKSKYMVGNAYLWYVRCSDHYATTLNISSVISDEFELPPITEKSAAAAVLAARMATQQNRRTVILQQ